MKRKDFIDGISLLTFSLLLVSLAGGISGGGYSFGIINSLVLIIALDIGGIFCLVAGISILLGEGSFWFKD